MPAGVSWPTYIKFFIAAMASMLAGSQIVHQYYRPLKDLNEFVDQELVRVGKKKPSETGQTSAQ